MPYLLKDLVIDRVDIVDEGANSEAFIQLFKRKEREEKMDFKEIIAKMSPEQGAVIQAELDRLSTELTKAKENTDAEDAITKAAELTNQLEEITEKLAKAEGALAEKEEEEETKKASTFDENEVLKSLPKEAQEIVAKMRTQKEAAEEELRKAKEAEQHAEAVSKAAALKSLPIEQDKLVEVVKGASRDVLELLKTVATAMEETVLGEIGKSATGSTGTTSSNEAWAQIEHKAMEIAKSEGITKAKAISKVVDENPDLYKQYLQGGAN